MGFYNLSLFITASGIGMVKAHTRRRLLAIAFAALCPFVALSFGLTVYSLKQQQFALRSEALHEVRDTIDAVERHLDAEVATLRALAASPALDGSEPRLDDFYTQVSRLKDQLRHWDTVILADLDGQQIVNTRAAPGVPLPGVIDLESFRQVIATKEPVVGNAAGPGPFAHDPEPRVPVRVPVMRDGSVRYVLTAVLSPERLAEFTLRNLDPEWRSFLVDQAGRIVASGSRPVIAGQRPSDQSLAARAAAQEGIYDGVTLDGVETIAVFRKSSRFGWSAHVAIPRRLYDAPFWRAVWYFIAALSGAFSLSALFFEFLRREALRRQHQLDLTEAAKRKAEQAADELRLRDRSLAAIGQGVVIADAEQPDQPIIYVNAAFEQLTGYSAAEVLGRNCRFLQGPKTDQDAIARIRDGIKRGVEISETIVNYRKDGSSFENQLLISPVRDQSGKLTHFVGVQSDATVRREAEEALSASEARYRLLAENSTDMITRTSIDGRRLYLSPATRDLLGYEPDELVGSQITGIIHPDDQALALSSISELLSHSEQQTVTYRLQHKEGRWVWLESHRKLVRDENGQPLEFVSVGRDVTERVQLEEQLRQAQKMEAIGQLTGGIAHDFNNLLTVILGNAELLTEDPSDPALTYTLARQILETAERGADLNQKLLAFGRRQSLKPERLKAETIVEGLVPLLYRTIGEHIELRTELGATQYCALTDRTLLESAVLNLVVNARDAMPQGGTLTITTGERLAGRGDGPLPVGQPVIFVSVSDTGTGIAPEVLERVFEPFFTTKDAGKGSGLGLSMVLGFAQQSAGHVAIESRVGDGTTVTIALPGILSGDLPAAHEDAKVSAAGPTGARVLLVEDEPPVLRFVSAQLTTLGYQVTAVSTGHEALDLLHQGYRFDLLFTDVVLPKGLSGVEVAQRAAVICPDLKVLLTSGYPKEVFQQHGGLNDDTILLRKPYRRKELVSALSKTLSRAA